jgi:DNA (cytosine-5)-methyltransferase 1
MTEIGVEWDADTCRTREAARFPTLEADVSALDPDDFAGIGGLIASPPCQPFSNAGNGKGLDDPRGFLVYEPMRYVRRLRPLWVVMEEVPAVLRMFEGFAAELRDLGYATWSGILRAEQYGVPQARRRAFLLASRTLPAVHPPTPTRTAYQPTGAPPLAAGPPLARWRSMADALGRGLPDRPSYTVTTRGNYWGGTYARRVLLEAQETGRWVGPPGPLAVEEFATLQSFPPGHPWQGNLESRLRQIGNAVPPDLAYAALSSVATSIPLVRAA